MIRWILLLFSLASLGLMFLGPSPAWVFFGVAGFLVGSIATALTFAQARIASGARQENLQHYEHLPDPSGNPRSPSSGQTPGSED